MLGPSTVTGFSMKTLTPFSMAYLNCTQRNAGGVAIVTMSPRIEGIDRQLVGVEADEFLRLRDVHLVRELGHERRVARLESVVKHVRHRDEFGRSLLARESVLQCAGAASAASDESNLNRVVFTRRRHGAGSVRQARRPPRPVPMS